MKRINPRLAALLYPPFWRLVPWAAASSQAEGPRDAQSSSEGASSSGQQPAAIPEEDYQPRGRAPSHRFQAPFGG